MDWFLNLVDALSTELNDANKFSLSVLLVMLVPLTFVFSPAVFGMIHPDIPLTVYLSGNSTGGEGIVIRWVTVIVSAFAGFCLALVVEVAYVILFSTFLGFFDAGMFQQVSTPATWVMMAVFTGILVISSGFLLFSGIAAVAENAGVTAINAWTMIAVVGVFFVVMGICSVMIPVLTDDQSVSLATKWLFRKATRKAGQHIDSVMDALTDTTVGWVRTTGVLPPGHIWPNARQLGAILNARPELVPFKKSLALEAGRRPTIVVGADNITPGGQYMPFEGDRGVVDVNGYALTQKPGVETDPNG